MVIILLFFKWIIFIFFLKSSQSSKRHATALLVIEAFKKEPILWRDLDWPNSGLIDERNDLEDDVKCALRRISAASGETFNDVICWLNVLLSYRLFCKKYKSVNIYKNDFLFIDEYEVALGLIELSNGS